MNDNKNAVNCRHYSIVVTQNYLKSLGFVDNKAVRDAVF